MLSAIRNISKNDFDIIYSSLINDKLYDKKIEFSGISPIPNPHSIVDKVIINEYINNYLIKIPIIKIIINNNVILFLRIVEYNLNKNNINLYIKKSIISFIL